MREPAARSARLQRGQQLSGGGVGVQQDVGPASAASTPAVTSSWPVGVPSASVIVTPRKPSCPRSSPWMIGATARPACRWGRRPENRRSRASPRRARGDQRAVGHRARRAAGRPWGAARRACCRCRSPPSPTPGKCLAVAATRSDWSPSANWVAYLATVSALNENARPCCQMNAPVEVGTSTTGARSMLIPQPLQVAAGGPALAAGDARCCRGAAICGGDRTVGRPADA